MKHTQSTMFATADLPLFSGTCQPATDSQFTPAEQERQLSYMPVNWHPWTNNPLDYIDGPYALCTQDGHPTSFWVDMNNKWHVLIDTKGNKTFGSVMELCYYLNVNAVGLTDK